MNVWRFARIIVTLASDLHCGDRPLGFVARTLPFVPGHIPWYALLARLPNLCKWPDTYDSYTKAGSLLDQSLRFTPFLPLDARGAPLMPWHEGKNRIEMELLGSCYGVAVHYSSRGTRENHLFETETILAHSRTGTPTRLLGYCFWKVSAGDITIGEDGSINNIPLPELLIRCQWGGQRNQGLGAIKRVELVKNDTNTNPFFQCMNGSSTYPTLICSTGSRVPLYLGYDRTIENAVQGKVMPLVGRRFAKDHGPGLLTEPAALVWDLGWQMRQGSWRGEAVSIILKNRHHVSIVQPL